MHKEILVVDDDAIPRIVLSAILMKEPLWEITEASDGQEALDLLRGGLHPDLCLIDLLMPKMDGYQLVARIRGDPLLQNLTIVITSASRNIDLVASLAKLQISGYLLKPYNVTDVHALLRKIFQLPA